MFAVGVKHKRKLIIFLFTIILLVPLPNFNDSSFSLMQVKYSDSGSLFTVETLNYNLAKSIAPTNNYSLISQWNGSLDNTLDVFVVDDLAYLADKNGGLVILDVSILTQPLEIGREAFAGDIVGAVNLFVEDDFAYIANDVDGARIIDISNKTDPQLLSEYHDETYYWDVYTSGDYAFFTTIGDGLEILNISDKINPIEISQFTESGSIVDVHYSSDTIFLADKFNGLKVLDISNKSNPVNVGSYFVGGDSWNVFYQEEVVYLANGPDGLAILGIDTDNDDLADYLELEIHNTDPLNPDSDGDGFLDGDEIKNGTNPNDPDDYPIITTPTSETSGFRFNLITVISFIFITIILEYKIKKHKRKLK